MRFFYIRTYGNYCSNVIERDLLMTVAIEKGAQVFTIKEPARLTVNQYLECTLTPRALGECIIAVTVKFGPDSGDKDFTLRARFSIVRKKKYYLGYEGSSKLETAGPEAQRRPAYHLQECRRQAAAAQ